MNQTLTISRPVDRIELAGAPRTTHAGRVALPVDLKDGPYTVATYDLVLDERAATELYESLGRHLAGRGAEKLTPPATRRRADLL